MPALHRGPGRRRVLLTAHTLLSLKYILRHHRLLASDPRIDFAITQVEDWFSPGVAEAVARSGIPVIPVDDARERWWDMVVFATHGKSSWFRAASKVHIQHGLGAGKRVDGHDFTYGREFALKNGVPRYDVMLEASLETRLRAVRACPDLAGRIAVVGDLFCDDVLQATARRADHRAALGCGPQDRVLLIMSTWGPHALMESRGRELLRQAAALPPGYRVLLTMHNHLWAGREGQPNPWPAYVAALPGRIRVCQPMEDWAPFLASADLAIVDHGSLGLHYALTERPALNIAVPDSVVVPTAPATRIRARYPRLEAATPLTPELIERTIRAWPGPHPQVPGMITSYPGQAAERTRGVLYQQLQLAPPSPRLRPPGAHRASTPLRRLFGGKRL